VTSSGTMDCVQTGLPKKNTYKPVYIRKNKRWRMNGFDKREHDLCDELSGLANDSVYDGIESSQLSLTLLRKG